MTRPSTVPFGVLIVALAGCASSGKHTVVPGPPMLSGGRMMVLDPSCGPRRTNGWFGMSRVVANQAELAGMIQCSTPENADDSTKIPVMQPGQVLAIFSMEKYGAPPALIGLERSDGEMTGVFFGVPYCAGALPPTSAAIALVELDAMPTKVTSRLELERSNCPMDLQ